MRLIEARLQFLLVAIVVLIVVYPFTPSVFVLNIMLTTVLFTALYAVGERKRIRSVALLLGFSFFIVLWLRHFDIDSIVWAVLSPTLGALFLGYVTHALLRHVIQADEVDAEMIYGAVACYLLLGLVWTMVYTAIETLFPGSFALGTPDEDNQLWDDLLYYSFVTLTTLGYGDVLPLSPRVRSLAILEAITGVFYVAILVARLVSLHIQQHSPSKDR